MRFPHPRFISYLLLLTLFLSGGCSRESPAAKGRVVIRYWEKWTGIELDAMRKVVDDYNASQDRIFVDFSSVSQMERKLMLATAGGVPPDVAGMWSHQLPVYAENHALTPLDQFASENHIRREDYIDVFWDLGVHRGHLWALPTTPTSVALVWNKKMFRAAGLDPERPPRSIAELEQFNDRLAQYRPDGRLEHMGFLPAEPGWWGSMWGYWFGAKLWDGDRKITANSPENVAAYQWIESYPKRFGASNLLSFRDGFGNFASSQDAFLSGRIAMEVQGVWIYKFIITYAAPDFEWGVAALPSADPEHLKDVTVVESDQLVIPAGAKHPKEAFEFIKYVSSEKPLEKLCMGQLKFSPRRICSPEFLKNHPHPHIREFMDLAKSPNAQHAPQIATWNELYLDMGSAVDNIWAGKVSARAELDRVEQRQQLSFDQREKRWDRLTARLAKEGKTP